MSDSILNLTPFVPSDIALQASSLPDQATQLNRLSAQLTGRLAKPAQATLERYMRVINSYYSNLIEGNATRPHEIRAAHSGQYSSDPAKRDLQKESVAHMAVQQWLQNQSPDLTEVFSPSFIKQVHARFYQQLPESLWDVKDQQGQVLGRVVPGEWRSQPVIVGRHVPPKANDISALISSFSDTYGSGRFKGDQRLIAIMAAHHRFAWIHPFLDGNGRVGRLITDAALKAAGLESYGVWCLSRGLAKRTGDYKQLLASADITRQGDLDGRGQLTEKGLLIFCDYMMATAIDQIDYINSLLDLSELRKRIDAYVSARNDHRVPGIQGELKPIASLILHTAFMYGELERSHALELCGMPDRSARRLLSQLKSDGLLSDTSNRSSLRWEIPEHAEPWYFPNLAPQV
ncbi:Fic family protein [Arenicella xantha]|uniref:Fic family protein n=1 Tax=Arenicella xantha TaxID=644221 RepID=A0A395JN45_9GAMM|nr:Fic family protein [Arenicella xantha]RBP52979.1 Fic family protein [Arenicella xantha]